MFFTVVCRQKINSSSQFNCSSAAFSNSISDPSNSVNEPIKAVTTKSSTIQDVSRNLGEGHHLITIL